MKLFGMEVKVVDGAPPDAAALVAPGEGTVPVDEEGKPLGPPRWIMAPQVAVLTREEVYLASQAEVDAYIMRTYGLTPAQLKGDRETCLRRQCAEQEERLRQRLSRWPGGGGC